MVQKVNCTCDKCKNSIVVKNLKKKLYFDGDKGKVYVHYFVCPHCLAKYPTHAESDEINKLTKRQRELRKEISNFSTDEELEKKRIKKIYDEINANKKKNTALQNEYKLLFMLDNKDDG
ncbi:hypothetical protein [Heyndrickxia oleronia]|uniref:hypothetical protein n=1 Tax=Heyndrickxia oleronia TaxID=38875 RepID=UPI001C0F10FA|nr:hypothetical protein [Heyndrickxia oleronia]MBU5214945.1 hypothetical protein [Heyndrickxia oleronia]